LGGIYRTNWIHENAYRILFGKITWGTRCRQENNIKEDVGETACEDVDLIQIPQNREEWRADVNMIIKFRLL
jgi:hypothetical protein